MGTEFEFKEIERAEKKFRKKKRRIWKREKRGSHGERREGVREREREGS